MKILENDDAKLAIIIVFLAAIDEYSFEEVFGRIIPWSPLSVRIIQVTRLLVKAGILVEYTLAKTGLVLAESADKIDCSGIVQAVGCDIVSLGDNKFIVSGFDELLKSSGPGVSISDLVKKHCLG